MHLSSACLLQMLLMWINLSCSGLSFLLVVVVCVCIEAVDVTNTHHVWVIHLIINLMGLDWYWPWPRDCCCCFGQLLAQCYGHYVTMPCRLYGCSSVFSRMVFHITIFPCICFICTQHSLFFTFIFFSTVNTQLSIGGILLQKKCVYLLASCWPLVLWFMLLLHSTAINSNLLTTYCSVSALLILCCLYANINNGRKAPIV